MTPRWPIAIERSLATHFKRRQRILRLVVLEALRSQSAQRRDEAPRAVPSPATGWWFTSVVQSLTARIKRAFAVASPLEPEVLLPVARAIDATTTRGIVRTLEARKPGLVLPPVAPLPAAHARWVDELVERLRAQEDAAIDRAMEAAALAATEGRDVVRAAGEALDTAPARAALTARDAVGTLMAEVARTQAPALGSAEYTWRTQGDANVRKAHRALAGHRMRWDDPHPVEEYPGAAFGCRCWADPV
jgi:SPP1 gp7 family putative phage head morphogenesis protein